MNQATLAWAAFKNMLLAAFDDPIWAISSLIMAPFRGGIYLVRVGFFILIVALVLSFAANAIPLGWFIARMIANLVVLAFFLALVFRALTNPMISHQKTLTVPRMPQLLLKPLSMTRQAKRETPIGTRKPRH